MQKLNWMHCHGNCEGNEHSMPLGNHDIEHTLVSAVCDKNVKSEIASTFQCAHFEGTCDVFTTDHPELSTTTIVLHFNTLGWDFAIVTTAS